MEKIILEGLEVNTVIGVYDWERTKPQKLFVDLILEADLKTACFSDDVADTLDYAKLADTVIEVAKMSQFKLLEALAQAISDKLFEQFKLLKLNITITKPNILPTTRKVAVCIERHGKR
jgi:dihydroneopterin aldolase